uniref:Zona pellucida sperm-binding protein 3 n=1 Tax=Erpetoichthys calabaricus TaxID=27687 RepID=A0A8C4RPD6_ERPCA
MVFGMGALCFFCCLLGGFPLLGLTSPIDDFQADKWDYNTPSRKIAKHGLGAARPKLFMPAKGIPFIISPFPESLLDPRVLTGPSAKLPPALKALLNPTPPRPVVTLPVIPKSDVSLACSISKMMVRVKKAFFGFGYTEAELVLGNKCKSNGKDEATGDLLFNYPLNACDGKRSTHEGCLTYENVLHFKPHIVPGVIRRKQPVNVALKCCYFRYYHVYKAAVHPTWSAPSGLKTLHHPSGMVLKLMDATFSKPFEAKEYHLGQEIHFQAVSYPNSTRQWLFLHSCFATPTPNPNSSPRYTVIDNYGCMVDSKQESCSSRFERPRMANVVSFTVSAFQFNDHKQVYFHCKMFMKKNQDVTNTAKFCTYNKKLSRWQELGGHDRVCECCDSVCGPSEYDEVTESHGPLEVGPDEEQLPPEVGPDEEQLPPEVGPDEEQLPPAVGPDEEQLPPEVGPDEEQLPPEVGPDEEQLPPEVGPDEEQLPPEVGPDEEQLPPEVGPDEEQLPPEVGPDEEQLPPEDDSKGFWQYY